jgi:hypothetical protein
MLQCNAPQNAYALKTASTRPLNLAAFKRFTATNLDDIGWSPPEWTSALLFSHALYSLVP